MKKVVVLVPAEIQGHIYKVFLEHNCDKEYEVVAVGTRETDKFDNLGVKYYQVDITKKEQFDKLPQDSLCGCGFGGSNACSHERV